MAQMFYIAFLVLLICFKSTCHVHKKGIGNSKFGIDFARRTFVKDGAPFRYMSGEIHYFRIHPSLWADRLRRVRHLGLNAIQVYVPWNFHEEISGVVDFKSESRDLIKFLKLAKENDLYVLLRIGPYACAEWENGGLPWWLLKTPDIGLRTSDERFLSPVKAFFDVLLPLLRNQLYINEDNGPILMLQIENEYGSYGVCDKKYMAWLRDLVHSHLGTEVTLYTTDGPNAQLLKCGTISDVFVTVDFGTESAGGAATHFDLQHKYVNGGPNVNSEFYTTWFSSWGEDQGLPDQEIDSVLRTVVEMHSLNASFSFYMVHGGTNFEFWNGAEADGPFSVLTSYDYMAPISEGGDISPLYLSLRNWIKKLPDWPQPPLEVPQNLSSLSIENIRTNRVNNVMAVVKNLIVDRECHSSDLPLNFEAHARPYTFVLYSTVLTALDLENMMANGSSEFVLDAHAVNNMGFVYLDDEFQGFVSTLCGIHNHLEWCKPSITLRSKSRESLVGRTLKILVENTGRITYETIRDFKGLGVVSLGGRKLTHWLQCGVDFELLSPEMIEKSTDMSKEGGSYTDIDDGPGIYVGHFDGSGVEDWRIFNTYFDSRPWAKGFVLVNGFNIGRYWPVLGPQVTLYAPGPVFHRQNNTVIVVELLGREQLETDGTDETSNNSDSDSSSSSEDGSTNETINKTKLRSSSADSTPHRSSASGDPWEMAPVINFIDHPIYTKRP